MHIAVRNNNIRISELLINKGGDVNAKDGSGNTPLNQSLNQEINKFLRNYGGKTREEIEAEESIFGAIEHGDIKLVNKHLSNGADVNARGHYGTAPLVIALRGNHTEIVKLLINKGADLNANKNSDEETPLHVAVRNNNFEISKLLIEKGADVNVKYEHETLLLIALRNNHPEIVKLLINKDADLNAKASGDLQPEFLAASPYLFYAAKNNNKEIFEIFIREGADVNANGVLQCAAENNNIEFAEILIEKGADVNAKGGHSNLTPLHTSVQNTNKEIAEFLIKKGADVNAKDEYGKTPLDWSRNQEVSKLLRKYGGKTKNELSVGSK